MAGERRRTKLGRERRRLRRDGGFRARPYLVSCSEIPHRLREARRDPRVVVAPGCHDRAIEGVEEDLGVSVGHAELAAQNHWRSEAPQTVRGSAYRRADA
jgi:hypothetical protein